MPRTRTPAIVLVRRRMEAVAPGPGGCREWPGAQAGPGYKAGRGYGITGGGRGLVPERVNRVVLEAKLGRPLRPGMHACHSCDNPPCAAEEHLFEGTQGENLQDASAKGRLRIGARNPAAVLTEVQATEALTDPRTNVEIAKELGVNAGTIRRLRKGQTWKHLART